MEENVQKELELLKGMVVTWKKDYLGSAPSERGGEFLAKEFMEEIETHVYPYVKRLYECEYLSGSEAKAFLDFCYDQVEEVRRALGEARVT
ncbi:MAG: hypothetical protein HY237_04440 [Acidobacteria bacterium]|nr:hypothetical protein [Acidobacteriota bacterium]